MWCTSGAVLITFRFRLSSFERRVRPAFFRRSLRSRRLFSRLFLSIPLSINTLFLATFFFCFPLSVFSLCICFSSSQSSMFLHLFQSRGREAESSLIQGMTQCNSFVASVSCFRHRDSCCIPSVSSQCSPLMPWTVWNLLAVGQKSACILAPV